MKTPTAKTTVIVIVLLALGTALLVVLAIVTPVGNDASALHAWNGKVLLGIFASLPLAFDVLVVVRLVGRRSDARFAASIDADLVLPIYIYPLSREQIRSMSPDPLRSLPTRAMMAVNRDGISLWGRPHDRLLTVPWSEISTVVPTEMSTARRSFAGLSLVLASQLGKVEVVLVGTGLLGIPTREQAVDVASEIRALRSYGTDEKSPAPGER